MIRQQDYNAMLARIAPKRGAVVPGSKAVAKELPLHADIMSACHKKGWIPLHGNPSKKSGRTLGEPDFGIMLPNSRTVYIECKARDEEPSPDQRALHARARDLGHVVHIVRNMEEFWAVVKQPNEI